jgi:murein L,D-transpeptidase YcbB/YkuD
MMSRHASCGIALIAILLASASASAEGQSAIYALANSSSSESAIASLVDAAGDDRQAVQVRDFYAARNYQPVWSQTEDAADRGAILRSTLEHADQQGLHPRDYTDALSGFGDAPQSGDEAARYDVAMTRALFSYARDVRLGQVTPGEIYKDVALPRWTFDIGPAFSNTLKRRRSLDAFLAALPPPNPAYRRLALALARYRAIAMHGGWPRVPAGASDSILNERLSREDTELQATSDPTAGDIQDALMRFQQRMGLDESGGLNAETLTALNISASYRVEEIAANMERWRWMPPSLEARYIMVNVPDQSLDLVSDGDSVLHSKVIIGKKKTPTPIMRAEILTVVANPPWDIPDDIAARSIWPHLRKNANYLQSRNMVLVGGNHVQQMPGGDNALGRVMLDAPNDFGVYLHDTPHQELFDKSVREFSNGCIRVEEILPLAALVMRVPDSDDSALGEAIASGSTQRLPVPAQIPIYAVYFTAIARDDGTVDFRPDRYNRDQLLIARVGRLLAKPAVQSAERKEQAPS